MVAFVPHEYLRFLRKKSITDVQLGDHVSKVMAVCFLTFAPLLRFPKL
jgi:hypothetical protein